VNSCNEQCMCRVCNSSGAAWCLVVGHQTRTAAHCQQGSVVVNLWIRLTRIDS